MRNDYMYFVKLQTLSTLEVKMCVMSPVSIAFSVSGVENDFYCLGVLILINTAHRGKRDRDGLQWR